MSSNSFPRAFLFCLSLLIALTPWGTLRAEDINSISSLSDGEFEVCLEDPSCSNLLEEIVSAGSGTGPSVADPVGPPHLLPGIDDLFEKLKRLNRVCLHPWSCECGVTLKKTWDDVIVPWLGEDVKLPGWIPSGLDLRDPDQKDIDPFLKRLRDLLRGQTHDALIKLLQRLKRLHPNLADIIDPLIEELRQRGEKQIIDPDLIDQIIEGLRDLIFPPRKAERIAQAGTFSFAGVVCEDIVFADIKASSDTSKGVDGTD